MSLFRVYVDGALFYHLLLSSLVPWVALLSSNSQAEGMLVKNC